MSPTALVFEGRHYTLPQLEALADGLAASLRKRGVTAGERVALMASNRPEFVVALHAIWRLAAVVVLISPAWKRHEVEQALALTGPSHAVGDQDVLSELMPMLHLDAPIVEGEPHTGPAYSPGADAVLAFSSGTTGLPKAVRHTHHSLQVAVGHWRDALGLTAQDRIQVATPPSHILGLLNITASISTVCSSTSKTIASPLKWPSRQLLWPSPHIRGSSPTIFPRCGSSCGARRRSAPVSPRP
jgi:long-chain acyl-CoA synthetase